MYKPGKKNRNKVKQPSFYKQASKRDQNRLSQSEDTYYKLKAIKYLDTMQDPEGSHKIACKSSAPRVKHQVARLRQTTQGVHGSEYQGILQARHCNGIWYRRVGKWLHHMGQMYRQWAREVECMYHVMGLRHALIMKNLQRQKETPPDNVCTSPGAKGRCPAKRITGQVRLSPSTPVESPLTKFRKSEVKCSTQGRGD